MQNTSRFRREVFETVEKITKVTFSQNIPAVRTAGIEVFFASAKPRQKTDYKRLLRRQMLFFRFLTAKTKTPGSNIREFSS